MMTQASRRPPTASLPSAESSIWRILLKRTDKVPGDLVSIPAGHLYQILEIVITRIASLLETGYQWTVSPVSGDRGIDFSGRRTIFECPDIDFRTSSIIYGQSKFKAGAINLVDAFGGSLLRMTDPDGELPSLIIMVALGKFGPRQRERAERLLRRHFRCQILLLSRSDIEHLIRHYLNHLHPLFDVCLSAVDRDAVVSHFSLRRQSATPVPNFELKKPDRADTGAPFELVVRVNFERPQVAPLLVRWVPAWEKSQSATSTTASQRLIAPAMLATPSGLMLDVQGKRSAELRLTFLSYGSGRRAMGTLAIAAPDGSGEISVQLGHVNVVEQFHPPFFRSGVEEAFARLHSLASRSETGLLGAVAVRGVGGTGKTRLCQEFGYDILGRGGAWLSISHTHTGDDPYRLVRDLLLALLPITEETSGLSPAEAVMLHIMRCMPALREGMEPIVARLFQGSATPAGTLQGLSRELLLKALVAMLVLRANGGLLGLHLSDLHWADAETLLLLDALVDRLKLLSRPAGATDGVPARIILVCEGRKGEETRGETLLGSPDYSTYAWERFSSLLPDLPIDLSELTPGESRDLLRHWFENQESPHRRIRADLLAEQDRELFTAILAHGSGNPFYMIQYVILLNRLGLVRSNRRTGRFFLARHIDVPLAPPITVAELIVRRFRYLENKHPGVATAIRAIALVQDRVPYPLYEQLRDCFAPDAGDRPFQESEFLLLPAERSGDVRFRHETFYSLLHRYALPSQARDKAVELYQAWLDGEDGQAPEIMLRRGLVLEQAARPRAESIEAAFRTSLQRARENKDNILSERALEGIMRRWPQEPEDWLELSVARRRQGVESWCDLVSLRTYLAKWSQARADLARLMAVLDDAPEPELDHVRFETRIQLANAQMHQMQHDDAIAELRRSLAELEPLRKTSTGCERDEWLDRWIRAYNRLGVAEWFNGNYEAALGTLELAYTAAVEAGDITHELYRGIDVAAVTIHSDPEAALAQYSRLEELERQVGSRKDACLIACQRSIAAFAAARARTGSALTSHTLDQIDEHLEQVYQQARQGSYANEQAWAALALGSLKAATDREVAIGWTAKALHTAFRTGHLDLLWMAHINLAQLCFAVGGGAHIESAVLHAGEAFSLLESDLSRRPWESARMRGRVIGRALLQITRIMAHVDAESSAGFTANTLIRTVADKAFVSQEPRWSLNRAICVDVGDMDLYLMA